MQSPFLSLHPVHSSFGANLNQKRPRVLGTSGQKESPVVKFLVSGGAALVFEASCGHFMEFLKVLKQTNADKSYPELVRGITKSKGIIGLWDGFLPWGAVQAVAKGATSPKPGSGPTALSSELESQHSWLGYMVLAQALTVPKGSLNVFYTDHHNNSVFGLGHVLATNSLKPMVDQGTMRKDVADVLAGGIGGGFQGFVLSPTLLLKTRVMTNPIFRERMSMGETTRQSLSVGMKVIREEGMAALMKGSAVFSAKRVADWSTRFLFCVVAENVVYKRSDPDYKLTRAEQIAAGLLGGTASTVCTLPLDVAVAQIQQASKAGQKVPLVQLFADQYREGGVKQLTGMATRGFLARLAHVSLTTALMKTVTSAIYDALYGR